MLCTSTTYLTSSTHVISTHSKICFIYIFLYHNAGNYINFSTRGENISIKTLRSGFIIDFYIFIP